MEEQQGFGKLAVPQPLRVFEQGIEDAEIFFVDEAGCHAFAVNLVQGVF